MKNKANIMILLIIILIAIFFSIFITIINIDIETTLGAFVSKNIDSSFTIVVNDDGSHNLSEITELNIILNSQVYFIELELAEDIGNNQFLFHFKNNELMKEITNYDQKPILILINSQKLIHK